MVNIILYLFERNSLGGKPLERIAGGETQPLLLSTNHWTDMAVKPAKNIDTGWYTARSRNARAAVCKGGCLEYVPQTDVRTYPIASGYHLPSSDAFPLLAHRDSSKGESATATGSPCRIKQGGWSPDTFSCMDACSPTEKIALGRLL